MDEDDKDELGELGGGGVYGGGLRSSRLMRRHPSRRMLPSSKRRDSILQLDLSTTLKKFGFTQGFNVEKYISDHYKTHNPSKADEHKEELKLRREMTADALRGHVTAHYAKFINVSREITHIEADMLQLATMLHEYRSSMKALTGLSLSYDDERMAQLSKEQEDLEDSQPKQRALEEELELEELAEELRTFIYERKFEKAVSAIEAAQAHTHAHAQHKDKARTGATGAAGNREEKRSEGKAPPPPAAAAAANGGKQTARKFYEVTKEDSGGIVAAKQAIEMRVLQLVETLTSELRSSNLKKYEKRRVINYLIRLKHEEKALHIFLHNRSALIKSEVRLIKFQGDISVYIHELSQVVFQAVGSTCTDFKRLFEERNTLSAVVVWAVEELEQFASIFKKQVFQLDDMFNKLGKCLKYAFAACTALESKGLSLSFVLSRLFTPSLLEVVHKHYKHVEKQVSEMVALEEWKVTELWVHDPNPEKEAKRKAAAAATAASGGLASPALPPRSSTAAQKRALKLTSSGKYLYDVVRNLLKEVLPILDNQMYPAATNELYPTVVQGMIRLFENYLMQLGNQARLGVRHLDDGQSLAILANAYYLADDLLPRVSREFQRQFQRPISELDAFREKLTRLHVMLQASYCEKRSAQWIKDILRWENGASAASRYGANPQADESKPAPTKEFVALAGHFIDLRHLVTLSLDASSVDRIIKLSLEELLKHLERETGYWEGLSMDRIGLNQFVLDLRFLLATCGGYATHSVRDLSDAVTKRALAVYTKSTGKSEAGALHRSSWFDTAINTVLPNIETLGKLLASSPPQAGTKSLDEVDDAAVNRSGRGSNAGGTAEREAQRERQFFDAAAGKRGRTRDDDDDDDSKTEDGGLAEI